MDVSTTRRDWLRYWVALYVVAVATNYVWEASQASLFVGMGSIQTIWWHCFVASLGDGIILWIIHLLGWCVFRQVDWFVRPDAARYGVMLGTGLVIAIAIEWVAIHWLHRWAYTGQMPLVPVLGIGITPVIQMMVLPPLIFLIVGRWTISAGRTGPRRTPH
jgi:hypothetical protein